MTRNKIGHTLKRLELFTRRMGKARRGLQVDQTTLIRVHEIAMVYGGVGLDPDENNLPCMGYQLSAYDVHPRRAETEVALQAHVPASRLVEAVESVLRGRPKIHIKIPPSKLNGLLENSGAETAMRDRSVSGVVLI